MAMKPRPIPVRPKPPIGRTPAPKPPVMGKPAPKQSSFKPVVSGTSKNVGERYSFQQDSATGTRYQKAPVAKAKGLSGQLVTSTAAQRASMLGRSRLNALRKAAGK